MLYRLRNYKFFLFFFFFSSRRRHTRFDCDWSSDVCSSDLIGKRGAEVDKLRDELAQLTGKEVGINVEEIKRPELDAQLVDRKSTRLNSSHSQISYAVFCLKKKKTLRRIRPDL